jgi:fructokinase
VDISLVQLDDERATGEVGVEVEDGEPRYTLHPGRAWERIACTELVREALAEASVLVYGTLAQRTPEGLAGWREAIRAAHSTCLKVCDVNLRRTAGGFPAIAAGISARPGAPLPEEQVALVEALEAADVVKVNDRELDAIARWRGWSDPITALRERWPIAPSSETSPPRSAGRRVVVVTHGAAGSTLYGEGAPIEIAGVPAVPGGDNIGCGDAYIAILVLGMTMGWDLATSGRAASRWAAAVAGARGATPLFTHEQIAALLEPA